MSTLLRWMGRYSLVFGGLLTLLLLWYYDGVVSALAGLGLLPLAVLLVPLLYLGLGGEILLLLIWAVPLVAGLMSRLLERLESHKAHQRPI